METNKKSLNYIDCFRIVLNTCPIWGEGKFWSFLPYTLLWIALDCCIVIYGSPYDGLSKLVYWVAFIIINLAIVGCMIYSQIIFIPKAISFCLQNKKYKSVIKKYPSVVGYIGVRERTIGSESSPDVIIFWIVCHVMAFLALLVPYISALSIFLALSSNYISSEKIDDFWLSLFAFIGNIIVFGFKFLCSIIVSFCSVCVPCSCIYIFTGWCFVEKHFWVFDTAERGYKKADLYDIDWQKYKCEIDQYERREERKKRVLPLFSLVG